MQPGYRFLNASATSKPAAGLSGENVPSMFVMTTPLHSEATDAADKAPTETAAANPTPAVPAPKPKPQATQASAAPAPRPQAAPVAPAAKDAAVPVEEDSQSVDTAETETAETASIDELSN